MLSIKRRCVILGQDAESSVVYGMPKAIYEIGAVDKQLPISKIPSYLMMKLK